MRKQELVSSFCCKVRYSSPTFAMAGYAKESTARKLSEYELFDHEPLLFVFYLLVIVMAVLMKTMV